MKAKYVMTDKGPILFAYSIPHNAFRDFKPTSAGFVDVDIETGKYSAYGKSVSLNLGVHRNDSVLIECAFEDSLDRMVRKEVKERESKE